MKNHNKLKKYILLAFLIILFIPMIQEKFEFFKVKPLHGAITQISDSNFTMTKWFNSSYQEHKEKYINENFGFRNYFVRFNNQIVYSLFSKANAAWVVVGKDNYLYEKSYIDAYNGDDFLGKDSINNKLNQLKSLQDILIKENKNIVMLFAAGKASYFPEFIPEKMLKKPTELTNYKFISQKCKDLNINHIDFNAFFLSNKEKYKTLLYPQYGIHWSYYGMCMVADSIVKYIEKNRNIDMPNISWNENEIKYEYPYKTPWDYDVALGMNLLFKIEKNKLAYPVVNIENDANKSKPKVLFISDSFFWGLIDVGLTKTFSDYSFWFYNKEIFPPQTNAKYTDQLDIANEIKKYDLIFILSTEATLSKFGWGFIEYLHKNYYTNKNAKIQEIINTIKAEPKWYNDIIKKAKEKNISIDSMLYLDAEWIYNNSK